MSINKKSMRPRIPGVTSGFSFSRSDYLNGKLKCYYGPGQRLPMLYSNPTEWPAAGTRLRVPRAVWLGQYFRYGADEAGATFSQTWRNYYYDTRFSTVIAFFDYSVMPPRPVYFGDGPYTTVTQNTDLQERHRLLAIFQAVKEHIESLPAHTSVEVIDWNDTATDATLGYYSDGFLQIAAPDTNPGPFFGTDFLYVWGGHALISNADNIKTEFDPYTPATPPESDGLYGNPVARLKATYDDFRGHHTLLYHPDQPWLTPSPTPAPGSVAAKYSIYYPYDVIMPEIQGYQKDTYDFLSEQLKDYGFEHPGGTSLISEDDLISAIANHFGFDPETGRDLG